VAYLLQQYEADAGIVISASHNPYQDNGIKIFAPDGQKIPEQLEAAIEADLSQSQPLPSAIDQSTRPGGRERVSADPYLSWLEKRVADGLRLDGWRVVIDCANGAASYIAPTLFSSLGASVDVLHANPTGKNINLACGAVHPEALQARVLATNAHIGLAFDGDADRLIAVDERGEVLDGDHLLYLLASHQVQTGQVQAPIVVASVMSNFGLERALQSLQLTLVRTPVGDKPILDELLRRGGSLGGEQSGHLILPRISLAGDGMVTALEVLRAAVAAGQPLSVLAGGMVRFPQRLLNLRVKRKPPLETLPELQAALDSAVALLGERGRILVRYSGTEPIVRLMVEASEESLLEQVLNPVAGVLENLLSR
jgi:phosphoglucosamine mutase